MMSRREERVVYYSPCFYLIKNIIIFPLRLAPVITMRFLLPSPCVFVFFLVIVLRTEPRNIKK